jgi:hypothetical protein
MQQFLGKIMTFIRYDEGAASDSKWKPKLSQFTDDVNFKSKHQNLPAGSVETTFFVNLNPFLVASDICLKLRRCRLRNK